MEVQTEIVNDSKVYGKRSQLRSQEPQMSQILSWNEGKDNFYDYKKNKSVLKFMSDYGRYKNLINKTKSNFVTEQQECFQKFNYLNKKESLKKFQQHFQRQQSFNKKCFQNEMEFKYEDMEEEKLKEYLKENEILRAGNQTKCIQKMHQVEHTLPQANDTIKIKNILNNHHMAQSGYYKKQQQEQIEDQKTQNIIQEAQQTESQVVNQQSQQSDATEENELENQSINKENSVKKNRKQKNKKQKRIENRVKKFKQQSRWLPNSAFQTYFGKPAFENYGRKNVNPAWGGPIYGNYLKTHNINPQRGMNKPKYDQVYQSSQLATAKINYKKSHISKASKQQYRMNTEQIENEKNTMQLTIKEKEVQQLGELNKVDLKKTQVFKSPKLKRHVSVGRKYLTLKKNKKQKKEQQKKPQSTKRIIDKIVDKSVKGFQIQEHYELNPKNYINVNPNFLKKIPYAGKKTSTKNIARFALVQINFQKII